ncbi:MAG: hypothetical protein J0L82_01840 [Deltaproteobacteria bacterium]|nr:hypothetical protein [Deltaproteobacteria bacterium]
MSTVSFSPIAAFGAGGFAPDECAKWYSQLFRFNIFSQSQSTKSVKIKLGSYGSTYDNAFFVAEELVLSGAKPESVQVVFAQRFKGYDAYAFVLHDGQVFDPGQIKNTPGKTVKVTGKPVAAYMKDHPSDESAIAVEVPAEAFLKNYRRMGPTHFKSEKFDETLDASLGVSRRPLSEYEGFRRSSEVAANTETRSPKAPNVFQRAFDRIVIPNTSKVSVCNLGAGHCYDTAQLVVEALAKKEVSPVFVRVLYISDFEGFNAHAVVVHDGLVFDALKMSNRYGLKDISVKGIPIAEYFRNSPSAATSRIVELSGAEYLQRFPNSGPSPLLRELSPSSLSGEPTENRSIPLDQYIRGLPK